MKKLLFIPLIIAVLSSSCMTNRYTVGKGPVGKQASARVFSQGKDVYLFWGLIGLSGHSQPASPSSGNYQVKTSYNVVDAIVTSITGGIFSMRSVKVLVNKDDK